MFSLLLRRLLRAGPGGAAMPPFRAKTTAKN